ncbi:MAG: ATP-binding cassette domain-containing protein [candidate division Zixibacteria bacterium]|nr:ATP-binding cassette domain-containing protein [candidate division Zixibacteria bacterium]
MIRLDKVNFGYNTEQVLHDVSFHIKPGESRIIMGGSGSGKSTILRLILGLDCPWSGEVYIDGENICGQKLKHLQEIRKQIGMVFQEGALFDSMTIAENVGYYLFEHTKKKESEIEQEARRMLEFVDLDPGIMDKLPEELSGGMRRRVAIARALLSTRPKIMLFDEPTTGLDPQATKNVMNLIRKLRKEENIAVIIVTHQIADALKLADKFVVIQKGRIVFDGDMDELRGSENPEVIKFLAPFRESISDVVKRNFV